MCRFQLQSRGFAPCGSMWSAMCSVRVVTISALWQLLLALCMQPAVPLPWARCEWHATTVGRSSSKTSTYMIFCFTAFIREVFDLKAATRCFVPPAGAQVAVSGAVKRPAIYELLARESTLSLVIDDAGGLTAAASLGHITVDRIDANRHRETVTLNMSNGQEQEMDRAAIDKFQVKDGDRIRIAPILPYSERAIYLQGHVTRRAGCPIQTACA